MKLSIDKKNGMTIYNVKFDNLADLYYYLNLKTSYYYFYYDYYDYEENLKDCYWFV